MRISTKSSRTFAVSTAMALIGATALVSCKEPKREKAPEKASASQFDNPVAPAATPMQYPEVEALRTSIPGGQMLLPDDPAFVKGVGWWPADFSQNEQGWIATSWTKGDYQVLDWDGPEAPGEYAIKIEMWRHQPFPTEKLSIEYLLPGATQKETLNVPLGKLTIEGKVQITEPNQKLHLEMRIPSFIPKDHIPGSTDPRDIGFQLTQISLTPVTAEVGTEATETTE